MVGLNFRKRHRLATGPELEILKRGRNAYRSWIAEFKHKIRDLQCLRRKSKLPAAISSRPMLAAVVGLYLRSLL